MEEGTAAAERACEGGSQINVTQWTEARALYATEPDPSSHTKSGKTPRLSKPDVFVDIS